MTSLSDLETFLSVLKKHDPTLNPPKGGGASVQVGDIHCPTCTGPRKVLLRTLYKKQNISGGMPTRGLNYAGDIAAQLTPSLHQMSCLQCNTCFTALIFAGPQASELAIFPNKPGGIATKNTPLPIAYYLDQAWRSQCAGALSAAVVMYRTALEHLLHQQGFEKGMLADKIKALGKRVDEGTAPEWVRYVPLPILNALRELGNGAAHTNEGDISKQAAFDSGFLDFLGVLVTNLLENVYERPLRENDSLARLDAITKTFDKKKPPEPK